MELRLADLQGLAVEWAERGAAPLPVVCAGDVFDKWNPPPELINFAIQNLPLEFYAIPGQHDLPHHRYDDRKKSGYWTLVEADAVRNLGYGDFPWKTDTGVFLYGFPWGCQIKPLDGKQTGVHLAVVHAYVWVPGSGYVGAGAETHLGAYKKQLQGYDAVLFGDNHKAFSAWAGTQTIFNHGTFMRRKRDELEYRPAAGILMSDGTIEYEEYERGEQFYLPSDAGKGGKGGAGLEDFLDSLETLGDGGLDFFQTMTDAMRDPAVREDVRQFLTGILDRERGQ